MTPTEILIQTLADILGQDPKQLGSALPRPCCGLTLDACWQRCGEETEE